MKKITFVLLFALVFLLNGCSFLTYTFEVTDTTSQTTTVVTQELNGDFLTYDDYLLFSSYHSSTYDLTDIETYNEILLATRDHIRRTNIQITSYLYVYHQTPWQPDPELTLSSTSEGSGVIYKEDDLYYYALTNYHVVDGDVDQIDYEIMCFGDADYSEATLIAYDSSYDIAVLRFSKTGHDNAELIDYTTRVFTKFNSGELVLAAGNPLDIANNVTIGEFISMETLEDIAFPVIYHDAAIHEGSSGGALVDVDGNLLGLNTWGIEGDDSYSFSLPIYIIYSFLELNDLT